MTKNGYRELQMKPEGQKEQEYHTQTHETQLSETAHWEQHALRACHTLLL